MSVKLCFGCCIMLIYFSENNMILYICKKSGIIIVTGRNNVFRLFGSSVFSVYSGFIVIKISVLELSVIFLFLNKNFFKLFFKVFYYYIMLWILLTDM